MTAPLSRALDWLAHAQLWLGLGMVAAYFAIRTLALPEPILGVWLIAAVALTFASPLGGLVILAAIGPFTEAQTADGRITAVPFLLAALGVGVVIRLLATRPVPRPNWPILLALLLLGGTALGVLNSYLTYGPDLGRSAAEMWVPGIGGAITVLIAAAWVAWRGSVAPLFVAISSAATAALVSLANLATNDYVHTSTAVGWLLRQQTMGDRLTGVIPAPNPAAVIFMLGFAGCVAVALLVPRRSWGRLLLLPIAAAAMLAVWLTGSRSGVLGSAIVVALIVFAWNRRVGLATGAAMVLGMVVLIATGIVRDVPVAADASRVDAWVSTLRMWADHPIVGAGFRSYEWLHPGFGSPILNAPHNEWLRLFGEEGTVVGIVGLAFALLTPLVLSRERSWIAAIAAATAAGVFVAACFNNPFIYTQVNVPAFAIIGTGLGLTLRRSPGPADAHQQL